MIDQNNQDNAIAIIDTAIAKHKKFLKIQYSNTNMLSRQIALLDMMKVVNLFFYYIMFDSGSFREKLIPDKLLYLNGINCFFDQFFDDFTDTQYAPTFLTENIGKIHSTT